jgi:hypothetical protein
MSVHVMMTLTGLWKNSLSERAGETGDTTFDYSHQYMRQAQE